MKYYTNVHQHFNKFLVRGYEDGEEFMREYDYSPTLYTTAANPTGFTTISGRHVAPKTFSNIREARDFTKQYDQVGGFDIYGFTNFMYPFIYETFDGVIDYDPLNIRVGNIDIEVAIIDGFPEPSRAESPVRSITYHVDGKYHVFAYCDYKPHKDDIIFHKCTDEVNLLEEFLSVWRSAYPDVITGWHIEFFDIPYLVNRIMRILGEAAAKSLSPWKKIDSHEIKQFGNVQTTFTLVGITTLDYIALYKKFTYSNQESYKLDHIAKVELKEEKLDYSEYNGLEDLYSKNPQKYIEYNVHDVVLVNMLDDKMKFIELVFTMAYNAKINYSDTLGSIKLWDVMIHNYLMDKHVVVPMSKPSFGNFSLVGGYVKDPQVGMHEWVVSFDLNSLYPHLIMQYNISPEKFVSRRSVFPTVDEILAGAKISQNGVSAGVAVTANGCEYIKDSQGFLPALMEKMYADRKKYKKEMLKLKNEYQKTKNEALQKEISRLDNLQMAAKICLNSAYGALANKYFRWFDLNHAEAITLSGQLSIRWIEQEMNKYFNLLMRTEGVDYVIASDTDSIYMNMAPFIDTFAKPDWTMNDKVEFIDSVCETKIQEFIDKSYQELADRMHTYKQMMRMKRECIANKGIWTAKKRYILNVNNNEGVAYAEPKLKMMGIEAIKSSTPQSCRDSIKESLKLVMNSNEVELQYYVKKFKDEFDRLPFEDIAFPRGITELDKWVGGNGTISGTPIHVKGSVLYNYLIKLNDLERRHEKITNGDKVKFCYLKNPNPYGVNVIASPDELPPEFKLDTYLDRQTQFKKAFIDPLDNILRPIGWEAEKKASLMAFFGE